MQRKDSKHFLAEAWAFIAIAVIAFVGGLLIGDLGSSTKTETVHISAADEATEAEAGAEAEEAAPEEATAGGPNAQLFTSAGCGSCHTLSAAGTTGTTGPNLEESLAPDDNTAGIEEMILDPNVEVVEGYPPNVMPKTYGQTLSKAEIHELAEFLVETTPAKPNP
jgi:mono/diheme cytochrome c family protein